MKLFTQRFDIRWSDLDANRHVANSAYVNFMSHTRMAFLIAQGFRHAEMVRLNIGPVLFHEHIHYFREVLPDQPILVTLALKGLSEDGMFFEFEHNIYGQHGTHHLFAHLMGGFIDMNTRKLTTLPEEWTSRLFDKLERTADFHWLSKEDTRKFQIRPVNRPDLF